VPDAQPDPGIAADFEGAPARFCELLDRSELTQALEVAWSLVRRLNRFVEEARPWDLAKDDGEAERLDQVLYTLIEGLRVVTLLLYPYLPISTEKLLTALGAELEPPADLGSRGGGQGVERIEPLFPKLG